MRCFCCSRAQTAWQMTSATPFDACPARPAEPVQHVLVLKKQYDLRPEREFRCFVRGHQLIGEATCLLCFLPGSNDAAAHLRAAAASCALVMLQHVRLQITRIAGSLPAM